MERSLKPIETMSRSILFDRYEKRLGVHYPHSDRVWINYFNYDIIERIRSEYDLIEKMRHFVHFFF